MKYLIVLFVVKRQGNETFQKKNVGNWQVNMYIGCLLFTFYHFIHIKWGSKNSYSSPNLQ